MKKYGSGSNLVWAARVGTRAAVKSAFVFSLGAVLVTIAVPAGIILAIHDSLEDKANEKKGASSV